MVQTKGKGASGRFTLPGLKAKKRRKAKNNLTKKWDKEQVNIIHIVYTLHICPIF